MKSQNTFAKFVRYSSMFFYKLVMVFTDILVQLLPVILKSFLSEKTRKFLTSRSMVSQRNLILNIHNVLLKVEKTSSVYWIHVASAGELEQIIPVCSELLKKANTYFLVSYFSPSAEVFVQKIPNVLIHFALPLDRSKKFAPVLDALSNEFAFKGVFFVRYEIWPIFLHELKKRKIPIFLLGAVARKTRVGLGAYLSTLVQDQFYGCFDAIFTAQTEDIPYFKEKISEESQTAVIYAGDPKWSRAKQRMIATINTSNPLMPVKNQIAQSIKNSSKIVIIFGSPHVEEQEVAWNLALQIKKHKSSTSGHISIICAPPEIDAESIGRWQAYAKNHFLNLGHFSELTDKTDVARFDLILLDTMGDLAELYSISKIAIIGGGFDGKLHNSLEPAAFGAAVLSGRLIQRAPEAERLLQLGGLKTFISPDALFQFLCACSSVNPADEVASHDSALAELNLLSSKAKLAFEDLPNTSEVVCSFVMKSITHGNTEKLSNL